MSPTCSWERATASMLHSAKCTSLFSSKDLTAQGNKWSIPIVLLGSRGAVAQGSRSPNGQEEVRLTGPEGRSLRLLCSQERMGVTRAFFPPYLLGLP